MLSPEDLLLHLCHHFWRHNLEGGIRPLCDVAEAAKYYGADIDWTRVAELSSQWQINSCSYLGLWLAREMLDAPIPQCFLKDLKPVDFNAEVIRWARARLLAHGESSLVFPDLLQLFWKGHSFKERLAVLQKIVSTKTVAPCSRGTSTTRAYVHYLLHVKYLLTRYGPLAWGLVSGDTKVRAAFEREENQQRLTKWLSSGHQ